MIFTSRLRDNHGRGVEWLSESDWKNQREPVSSGHDRTTALMTSQKLWLPEKQSAQGQASQYSSVKERLPHCPPHAII